jgi:phosphatidate cytidylyltransferase
MLKARIISAVIGIPILLAMLYAGGIYWWIVFVVMGVLALFEYYRMMAGRGHNPQYLPGYLVLSVLMLSVIYSDCLLNAFLAVIIIFALSMIFQYPRLDISDSALSFYGAFYLGLLLSFSFRIYYLDERFWIMLLSLLLTWSSDTGGYFAGRFWGRRALAPEISPNKTREGAAGAIILSILIAVVFFSIIDLGDTKLVYILMLGLSASIMAQIGDLMVSGMKRYFGVKDTGKIIPGHGGVLDRFDSFFLVVPLVFYFFRYFIQV